MLRIHDVLEVATVQLGVKFHGDYEVFENIPVHGTGFYVQHRGAVYLCTNWHNVSGLHFETFKPIQKEGHLPKHLVVREWLPNGDHTAHEYTIPLYDDNGIHTWREKKDSVLFEGKQVKLDIVLLAVTRLTNPINLIEVLDKPHFSYPRPTDAVIVLGYPIIREKPIWKTGHIAETVQPAADYFLINGRTKSGMSGSGVFSTSEISLQGNLLIGIYSGRIHDLPTGTAEDLNDLDIGIVWKVKHLLDLLPPEDAFPPKEVPEQL